MLRRRLAAAAPLILPGVAVGAQTGDQALVRVAHFAPGLLKGDVYVRVGLEAGKAYAVDLVSGGDELISNARFPSASDYQEVPAGTVDLEVRRAGSDQVLAKANNVKLASGSISSLVAVGGIGEKLELLDISDAATAVSAAGGGATGAGGTSPGSSTGGRRFALLLLIGGGPAAAAGFVVQRRRSTG